MKRELMIRRSRVWPVCVAVVALSWGSLCVGQDSESAELEGRVRAIRAQLKRLQEGDNAPVLYKEYWNLHNQLRKLQRGHEQEKQPHAERLRELANQREVQDWRQKISDKAEELRLVRRKIESEIQKRGRELSERRQAELAGVAVADVTHARALGFTALDYPRVDGSTSTQPLGMIIACKMIGNPYRWAGTGRYSGRWHIDAGSEPIANLSPFPDVSARERRAHYFNLSLVGYRAMAKPGDPQSTADVRQSVMINRLLTIHSGTHGAYVNVINGDKDVGLVARKPSADELELAKKNGVELDVEPFALDAFVFIKNHENPVTNLSTQQIRDIYSGQLKDWSAVGGPDKAINAYQRNRNSGSQELMETLVMKDLAMSTPEHGRARTLIHHGMGGPYIALTRDRRGLGYSVYYYEHFMAGSPNTRLMAVDGVVPSYETIRARRYPYVTQVYVVTRKGLEADSAPATFRTWLISTEGQAVVRESGYVPLAGPTQQRRQAGGMMLSSDGGYR